MQRRIPVHNLLIILAVVAVSFFTLDSGVSVTSCSICDTTWFVPNGVVLDGQ